MRSETELIVSADDNFVVSFAKLADTARGSGAPLERSVRLRERASDPFLQRLCRDGADVAGRPGRSGSGMGREPQPGAQRMDRRTVTGDGRRARARCRSLPGWHAPIRPRPGTVAPAAGGRLPRDVRPSGLAPDLVSRLFPPSFVDDPDIRLFVGRLDGRPAGTSIAIRSGPASGVYNVGTLPAARRRGIGTALTWAAVDAGRAWGCDTVVLQATEMALPLYLDMGFRTVAPYRTFTRTIGG